MIDTHRRFSSSALFLLIACAAIHPQTAGAGRIKITEEELCQRSDVVVIGEVISRKSFHRTSASHAIVTLITFKIISTANGAPPPVIEFVISGGEVNEMTAVAVDGPRMPIGSSHLLFIAHHAPREDLAGVQYSLIRWWTIPKGAILPDEQELQDIWEEHCTLGPQDISASRPTEKYIELIPLDLLAFCSHY